MTFSVYLMYEFEKREFLARIYLANEIISGLKSEVSVEIFQSPLLGFIATRKKPGLVIMKSCPIQYYQYLDLMKRRGFIIFLSQEEGVHYSKNLPDQLEFSRKCIPLIDKYFACHQEDSMFAQKMGVPLQKILITGNIRFELAYKKRKSTASDTGEILILENFDSTNIHNRTLHKNLQKYELVTRNYFMGINKLSKSTMQNRVLYQSLYKNLDKENIKFKIRKYILVRKRQTYREVDFQRTNILQDFEGRNIVVHYGSTAGLEAILAGKISLVLAKNESRVHNPLIYKISKTFESPLSLINFLKNLSRFNIPNLNSEQLKKLEKLQKISYSTTVPSKLILNEIKCYRKVEFSSGKLYLNRIKTYTIFYKNRFTNIVRRILRPYLYEYLKSFKISRSIVRVSFSFLEIDVTNLDWKTFNRGRILRIRLKK